MIKEYIYTLFSILRIIKNCHIPTCFNLRNSGSNRILRILGNGKSLNENTFQVNPQIDYMVVNRHVLSDTYGSIKPLFYVIADPFFFTHKKGLSVLKQINNKTSWRMYLCVPFSHENRILLKEMIQNTNIQIKFYNTCSFVGINRVAYYLYKHQLSMPVLQNVLVACIMLGIYMQYLQIELYGVEHTWTKYLSVHDDNLVYLENPHFFDKEPVDSKPLKDIQLTNEYPFFLILENYSRMFRSYWEIKNFLKQTNSKVQIINKTRGSFIDAFKRG